MNGPNRHSIFERIQQDQQSPSLSSALQPNSSFFNNSSLEPDSLEDFDFESAPPAAAAAAAAAVLAPPVNMSTTTHQDEHEPIPHSSGLTGNSNVTSSYATSTTPILQQQQQLAKTTSLTTTEEEELYCLKPIKDDLSQQDTISADQQQRAVLKERPFKNYQLFPGNTRFLCGGRLVTSRDYRAFIAGLIIFITPTVLFGYFVCPFLWTEIHPALPIVFAYLFILALASMLKTSWTDPGIIPRNLDPIIEEIIQEAQAEAEENASIHSKETPPKEILIKNTSYSLRYCDTCRIYRPPRASHCRQCDNCVEFEDHHCAWLNNCVGRRNYRTFFTFIMSAALCAIFVISSVIYQLLFIANQQEPMYGFGYVFLQAPVSFVLAIYCFILLWLVGGLTLYHCSLILRGVTTHEHIRAEIMKAKYPELHVNPYNKMNPFKNMCQVLCQPQPKSYLRRRKMADPVIEKS